MEERLFQWNQMLKQSKELSCIFKKKQNIQRVREIVEVKYWSNIMFLQARKKMKSNMKDSNYASGGHRVSPVSNNRMINTELI